MPRRHLLLDVDCFHAVQIALTRTSNDPPATAWRPGSAAFAIFPQAGGIFDGRGLASALAMGAHAVWVGTRFVAAVEASGCRQYRLHAAAFAH